MKEKTRLMKEEQYETRMRVTQDIHTKRYSYDNGTMTTQKKKVHLSEKPQKTNCRRDKRTSKTTKDGIIEKHNQLRDQRKTLGFLRFDTKLREYGI